MIEVFGLDDSAGVPEQQGVLENQFTGGRAGGIESQRASRVGLEEAILEAGANAAALARRVARIESFMLMYLTIR